MKKTPLFICTTALLLILVACGGGGENATAPTPLPTKDPAAIASEQTVGADETLYIVDNAASSITWTGSKPIGDSHTGTINLNAGTLVGNGDAFVHGRFTIDMTTITDSENSARLENHLRSEDFFNVVTHPIATLEIISATPTNGGYEITANLTIKEITNEITFPATVTIADGTINASADITFDRSKWDVRYGSGAFFSDLGDDLINDEIELQVVIVAKS